MNEVIVEGSYKSRRILAENVVNFCIKELMPRMKTLCIEVSLISLKGQDAWGWFSEGDNNREYHLEIEKSLTEDEFIETLAHEMVHVYQGSTLKIKDRASKRFWKCKDGKYRNYNDVDYAKQPWEVEAYRMEGPLLKKYKEINCGDTS